MMRPSGIVTFVFTDIEGSTRRWEQHPVIMQATMARHDALVRQALQAHAGYIFKTVGDAFCATFQEAAEALQAALAIQRAMLKEPWAVEIAPLRVRIALHTGQADEREGDYFGPPVNRVARLRDAGHGGQVLLSAATAALVATMLPAGVGLRDMGERRLRDLVRPERIYQVEALDLPQEFPALRTLDNRPHNLPTQVTSFVGREREIGEIKRLLGTTHLLTLIGSGGTGKTRLALHMASDLIDRFADGVWFVELAPLRDPGRVPQAIAQVLGIHQDQDLAIETVLINALRGKEMLLLLDNCEHLIEACAQITDVLLRGCPQVRVLASSREALGILGETTLRLPSLTLPDLHTVQTPEVLLRSDAVRLFVDRSLALQPNFHVTQENAVAIAQVCQRLDGIPLALELAAARVKMLTVEQIAARLDDRFRLLTGGSRTALPRQQTLRALIDWSYDLLSGDEQALLRWLAVFAGGWTLEAAEAICAAASVGSSEPLVLDLLLNLVNKSLVSVEEVAGQARYRLLETIRQYARDRLFEAGEAARLRTEHLAYFVLLAEQAAPHLTEADQGRWLEMLEAEHDNLRTALDWAQADPALAEQGLRLAVAVSNFWLRRGHYREGCEWLHLLLPQYAALDRLRAAGLQSLGMLGLWQLDASAHATLIESAALYRQLHEEVELARVLVRLGGEYERRDDLANAESCYSESLALGRKHQHSWLIGAVLVQQSRFVARQGQSALARTLLQEALERLRAAGDLWTLALGISLQARLRIEDGAFAEASLLFEESLALLQNLGATAVGTDALLAIGQTAVHLYDYDRAGAIFEEVLARYQARQDHEGMGSALISLANIALYQGNYAEAMRLFNASQREYEAMNTPYARQPILMVRMGLARVAWFEHRFEEAIGLTVPVLREYHELGLGRGIAFCLWVLAAVEGGLGRLERAARLWGAAQQLRDLLELRFTPQGTAIIEAWIAKLEAIDPPSWEINRQLGFALTQDEAVAYALEQPS